MTTWVSSDFWAGWVADCGLYIGPWPPAPPIPANVPAGFGVDYFITDATEADVVSGAAFGPTSMDVSRDSAGGALSGIGRDPLAPVTGGQLWAIIWSSAGTWPTPAPSFDGLTLVPALYVADGQGTNVGDPRAGSWGAPFAFPDALKHAPSFTSGPRLRSGAMPEQTNGVGGGHVAIEPFETAMLGEAHDNAPTEGAGVLADGNGAAMYVSAAWTVDGGTVTLGESTDADFTGTGHFWDWDPLLVVPAGLIEGIDFAANPTSHEPTKAVNDATTAFLGWLSLVLDYMSKADHQIDAAPTLLYGDLLFELVSLASTPADDDWGDSIAATVLGGVTVSYPDSGTPHTVSAGIAGAGVELCVTVRVADIVALTAPIENFGGSGTIVSSVEWLMNDLSATITADVDYPDLQLWAPPPLLAWHTVGGHHADLGDVPMKILTPDGNGGLIGVDIVDGPG